MKKILNILASISLVTSGAGSVIACGSTHKTSPPPTETDNIYNKLNQTSKPFLLNQDNNFWGNETNYRKDLLSDLEKVAAIPAKDDSMLSLNDDVKPLTKQGVQYIDVNIGSKDTEKIAVVKIDWELTKAQQPIYQFYTQTWPETTVQYASNILSLFYGGWDKTKKSPYWKTGDSLGWWQNGQADDSINHSIPWNDSFNTDIKNYLSTLIEGMQMPTSIKNMLHVVKPSTVKSLNISKSYNIPLDNIYLLSNGVQYNLGYYASYDATKSLSKMQNWKIIYDTYYNYVQNEFQKTPGGSDISYLGAPRSGKTMDASTNWYRFQIDEEVLLPNGYGTLDDDLSFKGSVVVTTDIDKPFINEIDAYYDGAPLGFQIKVEADVW